VDDPLLIVWTHQDMPNKEDRNETTKSAGCLMGIVAFFSRFMLLMFWSSPPAAWNAAFGGFIIPQE
jgi:hypothetical protein